MPKVAVIKFPGTNCDLDVVWVLRKVSKLEAYSIWFTEFKLGHWDAVVLPGGFSYGDWLRAGAISARSEVLEHIREGVSNGLPVLGICNGFQILTEAGILPGTLLQNETCRFICRWVKVKFHNPRGPWLKFVSEGLVTDMPIAHGEGRYYIDREDSISGKPLIKYVDNPNGSLHDVAGIASDNGVVLGLMPHPERAAEPELLPKGCLSGGLPIWLSISESLRAGW